MRKGISRLEFLLGIITLVTIVASAVATFIVLFEKKKKEEEELERYLDAVIQ